MKKKGKEMEWNRQSEYRKKPARKQRDDFWIKWKYIEDSWLVNGWVYKLRMSIEYLSRGHVDSSFVWRFALERHALKFQFQRVFRIIGNVRDVIIMLCIIWAWSLSKLNERQTVCIESKSSRNRRTTYSTTTLSIDEQNKAM